MYYAQYLFFIAQFEIIPIHCLSSFPTIKEIQHAAEKLGTLLASRLYEGQTDQFKRQLREVSQNTQLSLKRVINYPIKRYNDRTCVHLAASNGLFECLKGLLQSGGKFTDNFVLQLLCYQLRKLSSADVHV